MPSNERLVTFLIVQGVDEITLFRQSFRGTLETGVRRFLEVSVQALLRHFGIHTPRDTCIPRFFDSILETLPSDGSFFVTSERFRGRRLWCSPGNVKLLEYPR
jgi:hypothetical protein